MAIASLTSRPAWVLFHVTAVFTSGIFVVLAILSNQELPPDLGAFYLLCGGGFALSLVAAWTTSRAAGRVTFWQLLMWCAVLRTIAVCGSPIYEDDYYRYLWDGRQTVEAGTPYGVAPAEFFLSESNDLWVDILDNINNPEIATIYGPMNQYVFALAYLVAPGEVWFLQLAFAVVDLLVIALLGQLLLSHKRATLSSLVLYGFSPLIIKEFSFTAHPDVLALAGMVAALILWRRQLIAYSAVALAVAVASKIFAFLLVPLLLRWHWRAWLAFLATMVALYLPLGIQIGGSEGLAAMASAWLFNAPLYFLLLPYVEFFWLKLLLPGTFAVLCAVYFFAGRYQQHYPPEIPRCDWLFLALILALPAFNAWYYPLVLIFAVIYPSAWAWVGSFTVLLAYVTGLTLQDFSMQPYAQPTWALMAEWTPILVAAGLALARRWRVR